MLQYEPAVALFAAPRRQFHPPVAADPDFVAVVYSPPYPRLLLFYSGNVFHHFVIVVEHSHQALRGNAICVYKYINKETKNSTAGFCKNLI